MKISKPLFPGSCLYEKSDSDWVLENGGVAILIGAIAALRSWRIAGLVRYVVGKRAM